MAHRKFLPGEAVLDDDEYAELARQEARAATRYCRECGNYGYHHPHCPAIEDEDFDYDEEADC